MTSTPAIDQLVLGVDGGGTKTVAWLAQRNWTEDDGVIGRGQAGASNPEAVGFSQALEQLDLAIRGAFDQAARPAGTVAEAVLAFAGVDREENRQTIEQWAKSRRLAAQVRIVHDGLPLMYSGDMQGWGIGLVSGTGSIAFGQSPDGRSARAGGWGFLFGDEGSAFAIGLAGLRASAKAADGRGPATGILAALLGRFNRSRADELIAAVYRASDQRSVIASLADAVTATAAGGDEVALEIVDHAAAELAQMVQAVVTELGLPDQGFPLATSGGVLVHSQAVRQRLLQHLDGKNLRPEPVVTVTDPVAGAVALARQGTTA